MGRLLEYFNHKFPYSDFHELNADWLISAYKELIAEVDKLDEWKITHEEEYEQLKLLYDNIVSGNFPDEMKKALYNWTVQNSASIMHTLIKMLFFGITDDGYFVAYIPDGWDDIQFATSGYDYSLPGFDYGHLILLY